jgi:hypothetical protein
MPLYLRHDNPGTGPIPIEYAPTYAYLGKQHLKTRCHSTEENT